MKTAILIPCFNEAETIGKVVADFLSVDPTVVVYVYDNNSTDDTATVAEEAGAIVGREHRQGKGWVVRSMLKAIDADCYVLVDGDDTYSASETLSMRTYVESGTADMVIGDRMSTTYSQENTRPFHEFGNRLVRLLVNRLFGSDLHDVMTGCRCMSRRFAKMLPVTSAGFEIETEMTIHALDKGFLVLETPVSYHERGPGSHSKLNTMSDGSRVLRTIFRLFRDYRPLRFFGAVAMVLAVVSLGMFLVPLDEYLRTGLVTRFPTLIVSMGLGIAALLAFTSGVLLDSIRTQSRQSYELQLTMFDSLEALRGGHSGPRR